jgi:sugar phosphate isomerase/epimerase
MTQFYFIPDARNPEATVRFAKEQDAYFEYNDFIFPDMLDDTAGVEERIALYRSLDRDMSKDTMHGAFFDVTVFSYDAKIREISLLRMRQSLEIAKQMGLRAVVFHGNYLPFLQRESYDAMWLSYTEEAIRMLAKEYPGIGIYIENMFEDSPELLVRLAERMKDVPSFGLCLDYAHAMLNSGEAEPWMRAMAPYLRHMHINDHCFDGDVHLVPGDGKTDWQEYRRLKERYAPEVSVLCEVKSNADTKRSLEFLNYLYKNESI